ncbi:MAG TPA: methyltransferase domain-containing protein [Desulfuromonadales bacterium]|nr:methyltransferase domain-containing protein [Desulfuromonadales bacterium]
MQSETNNWTIPDLLQIAGGYWSTCALHTAVKLDVFSSLDSDARSAADVARLLNTDPRATGMLLDALAALGLLEKRGEIYVATPFAAQHLSKNAPGYLGHIIMHHYHLMPSWARLDQAVTSGAPVRENDSHRDNETARESFLMGMFNLASLLAPRIAREVPLSGRRTFLDLGGGPGTYAIHFCMANPELTAVIFDLPTTRTFAEATIARFDLERRISFTAGDYHHDPLPSGFDVVWMSHVLHMDGPPACSALLRKAVDTLNPGGVLMVQEFVLQDTKDGPPFPALFSLNMLLGTETGRSYSEQELAAMMAEAGLKDVVRLALELPNGAGILCGRNA